MPIPESSLEALANRVAKLETQNRRLKKTGIALLIVTMAMITMGQTIRTPDVIRAQKFVVVNASGKEQAVLVPRALYLYDDEGVKRVDLGTDSGKQAGAGLSIYNHHGNQMVSPTVSLDNSAALGINDDKGNQRADVGVYLGIAGLGVYGDSTGKSGAKLEAVGDSSSLQVYGPQDSTLAELNTSSTEASLYLSDNKGFGAVLGNGSLVPSISNAPRGNQQSAASLYFSAKARRFFGLRRKRFAFARTEGRCIEFIAHFDAFVCPLDNL